MTVAAPGGGTMSKDGAAAPVVAPGAQSEIAVRVTAGPGGAPLPGAQVTLFVTDRAILDLRPLPLTNVSREAAVDLSASIGATTLDARRATRGALNATFEALVRRLALDPFLPLYTRFQPGGGGYTPAWRPGRGGGGYWLPPFRPAASPVDVPDAEYLAGFASQITLFPDRDTIVPGRPWPMPVAAEGVGGAAFAAPLAAPAMAANGALPVGAVAKSAAAPAADAAGGAGGSAAAGAAAAAALRLSADFAVTPLFAVATAGADGRAVFSFKAPPNLGTFEVRAYAAAPPDGEAPTRYGAAAAPVVVRRPLSLVPSAPRVVRAGDFFEAGVVVSTPGATSEQRVSVTASAGMLDGTAGKPVVLQSGAASDTATVPVPAGGQQELRFRFAARAVGNATLRFAATAAVGAGGAGSRDAAAADSLEVTLPVLGRQGEVFVATSFAVRPPNASGAAATAGRAEGLALPRAEAGAGALELLAGVGYLPAVTATFEALARQQAAPYGRPTGALAVAVGILPAMLAQYRGKDAPPKAWLSAAQAGAALSALDDAAGPLNDGDRFGLLPFDPSSG